MLHVTEQVPDEVVQVAVALAIAVQFTGGDPQEVLVLGAQTLFAESTWKPALQVESLQAPLGVAVLTEQTPAPLAYAAVQFAQTGWAPGQVVAGAPLCAAPRRSSKN